MATSTSTSSAAKKPATPKKTTAAKKPAAKKTPPKAAAAKAESTELETVDAKPKTVADQKKLEQANNLHKQALDARNRIDEAVFDMAEVLYALYDDGLYVALGYQKWNEYVEQELDFQLRKAQYLVQMWEWYGVKLAEHPTVREKIKAIGWTKAKELVGIVDQSNVDEWVVKAKGMNAIQLTQVAKDTMKKLEGGDTNTKPSSDAPSLVSKSFKLTEAAAEDVNKALTKAGEMGNTDKPAQQLEFIITDFLGTNGGMGKTKAAKRKYLKKIESLLGLNLVAIDPETTGVVYGEKTIDKIVAAAGE